MKSLVITIFTCLIIAASVHSVRGQAPRLINFQAQADQLISGTAAVTFAIFDAASGGAQLWSESYPNLSVQNGRIQVLLGSTTVIPAGVFENDGDRYLAITINGETLSPRSRLTSVAYALRAAVADRVTGGNGGSGVASLNSLTGDVTLVGGTNVSVTPEGQNLRIDATGVGGIGGITTINAGTGIAVSDVDGPVTEISIAPNTITDAQIQDNSLGASSLAPGSVGSSELQSAITLGSNGRLDVQNPSGQTRATLTTNNDAGFLGIDANDGIDGVTLEVLNGNAFGRVTVHNLSGEPGIRLAGDQTGTDEYSGQSLYGGSAVVYKRDGQEGAVWSRVVGTSPTTAWGVVGVNNASNNEVIRLDGENGNLSIAGTLSKGGGSFKIDHPLDPTNKYLSHSFVESPDMMNIYNGNAMLDNNGEAWIDLPAWFEALNRDFRYQLTCIGGQALVYVAEEIADNRFKIAGGTPGLKVSWQVTGVRQDPYAEAHRIKVEEEKPAEERGSYLHPEAYSVKGPESGVRRPASGIRGSDDHRN